MLTCSDTEVFLCLQQFPSTRRLLEVSTDSDTEVGQVLTGSDKKVRQLLTDSDTEGGQVVTDSDTDF